ncbi:uncharacterized protein METZ01_LOCUS210209 [marine metagenome]|uniref:Uncharacterized protein n=1 Tax=marine metagenome TaxID=408172 RepID=A0A382F3V0_9ZZZZ
MFEEAKPEAKLYERTNSVFSYISLEI